MLKIKNYEKDSRGEIIGYRLSNAELINKERVYDMVKSGEVDGAVIGVNENGEKWIHVIPKVGSEQDKNDDFIEID